MNPDGLDIVAGWYQKNLGTPYETTRPPELYHHYVGHDDNRDFYMLTQAETRAVNDLLYHRWFPQVFLDEVDAFSHFVNRRVRSGVHSGSGRTATSPTLRQPGQAQGATPA